MEQRLTGTERRRVLRAWINRPGRIRINGGPRVPIQLMDVSAFGARLFYSAPISRGTPVKIKFYLNTETKTILLKLHARVEQSSQRGESHLIRVAFTDPPPAAILAIHEFAGRRRKIDAHQTANHGETTLTLAGST